jgi:transmembrane sensor
MGTTKWDNKAQLREIIKKYLAGKATVEEKSFLEHYFEVFENRNNIVDQLSENEKVDLEQKMEAAIFTKIKAQPPVRRMVNYRIAAAAVLIGIMMTAGLYFYFKSGNNKNTIAKGSNIMPPAKNDIDPGGNRAILVLGDGTEINLDDSKIGELTQQGDARVSKTTEGQVVYNMLGGSDNKSVITTNTIQTPAGGEYQVVLPDGTKVWLNSSSKLQFPTAFAGKERVVTLSGEGYFEVAKDASMPFKVKVNDMEVKVLGTHFNIMAYSDESQVKTTLLEGSVNIVKNGSEKLLKPGQQARTGAGDKIDVVNADAEAVVAWKNGYFKFNKDGIQTVMRQLARWYDMEVVYQGAIPKDEFSGKIRRNIQASKALEFLQQTGLHFKIEGKKVTVL